MKCPNCSAEVAEKTLECEFCGHPFIDGIETQGVAPTSDSSGRAVFTASEPSYKAPEAAYNPPPAPSGNPYSDTYPPTPPSISRSQSRNNSAGGHVPNYLVWAILATLCCCLPGGIVAIVYAAQVDGKLASGDYHGAVEASNNAKMWSWISFGGGLLILIPYFFLVFLGAAAEAGGI